MLALSLYVATWILSMVIWHKSYKPKKDLSSMK